MRHDAPNKARRPSDAGNKVSDLEREQRADVEKAEAETKARRPSSSSEDR